MYKDANHKPEMAVALSVFEALSGFVTAPELDLALTAVPELRATVGRTETRHSVTRGLKGECGPRPAARGAVKKQPACLT